MHNPVRTSASWLAGRVLVFLVILVALVAWDAYRDESLMVAALTKGLLPDRELVERLETGKRADWETCLKILRMLFQFEDTSFKTILKKGDRE